MPENTTSPWEINLTRDKIELERMSIDVITLGGVLKVNGNVVAAAKCDELLDNLIKCQTLIGEIDISPLVERQKALNEIYNMAKLFQDKGGN